MELFQLLLRLFFNNMLISENASILEIKRHSCWISYQIVTGNQSILHSVETSLDARDEPDEQDFPGALSRAFEIGKREK